MSRGFELVPLDCTACGAPLAAGPTDLVFYCTACRSGFRHEPSVPRHLAPVEVAFVASPHRAAEGYAPFWMIPARVHLERSAGGGVFSGLMGFLAGDRDGSPAGEGTFVLPAFHLPIEQTVALALRYTEEFPLLDQLLGERLTGGTVSPEDARKLAHYVLIASEVRKPDVLKDLDYRLDLDEPRLLGVPWLRAGDGRADALFGLYMGTPEE